VPALLGLLLLTIVSTAVAFDHGNAHGYAVALTNLIPLGLLGLVFVQWASHPTAFRDAVSGGYLDVEEGKHSLRWREWGILFTRQGSIDEAEKRVRLEWHLLLGLVPIRRIDRSILEFYRVAVVRGVTTTGSHSPYRRHDGLGLALDLLSTPSNYSLVDRGSAITYTYSVAIVDRHAYDLTLFSLSEFAFQDAADQLVGRVRERLERVLGVPDRLAVGSPLIRPPKLENDEPASPPHGPRMTCPNCHRSFALASKTCPSCHVALFDDT